MSEHDDDGLDCCRGIVNAILLSLPLWAVVLGISYGAWKVWHAGRLADATVIFGFVDLILVGLSAWLHRQLLGVQAHEASSPVIKVLKLTSGHAQRVVDKRFHSLGELDGVRVLVERSFVHPARVDVKEPGGHPSEGVLTAWAGMEAGKNK